MKVLAQYGYGPKDKLDVGLGNGSLDGVIFSPRYVSPSKAQEKITDLIRPGSFFAIDPEYYASDFVGAARPNLGSLEEWDYFRRPRRSQLITGSAIPDLIRDSLKMQSDLGATHLISPNVYIRHADSVDTAIALNFLAQAKSTAMESGYTQPVYGTIALHRDAIISSETFRDILDSLTSLENPLDGYYFIVGSNEQHSTGRYIRSDLSQAEVIAGAMYANYVLSQNGWKVINGYSYLLSPLLAACGAEGAANGWSSGLRKFCHDRYVKTDGRGMPPNVRYLCNSLLSHILQTDLDNYRALLPDIANDLDTDQPYLNGEPTRTEEALQSWDALANLYTLTGHDYNSTSERLDSISSLINAAHDRWIAIRSAGFTTEVEPNMERLQAMKSGIEMFRGWAEIPS